MERPSVQAPDTFYPEAGSHMPLYAAAVKKPKGAIFPVFCTFPAGKGLHPASPCSHDGSPEKYGRTPHSPLCLRYRSSSRISPSRFQLTVSAAPLHHGRKNRSSRKRKGMLPYSPG
ncbi:hypothetical protein CXT96_08555 [Akkermansia muciniphila]|nr:hypothetical protein CXT92_05145 [Akkermansia muciniphila]PNC87736.1 hypothetical protein CXT97_00165 [Akkermansia muciniphila]PNC93587.1 hypothetical protein CXT89_09290 [Akkermansia muciniphila]PND02991.1 hypothetical protein CXT90_00805 [Akkermansia muciniphila]PND13474.1 hypothetical protein CXT96_08555 [Akkermansia muciniphila]